MVRCNCRGFFLFRSSAFQKSGTSLEDLFLQNEFDFSKS